MPVMSFQNYPSESPLPWAITVSVLIHALILMVPRHEAASDKALPRLQARLAPPAEKQVNAIKPAPSPKASKSVRPRIMTTRGPSKMAVSAERTWSAAEKADMNRFLDGLDQEAKAAPKPTLAQRSMAMAREQARQLARQDESGDATLELRPNEAPPDPFSLEMYVDALIKRLNRSAGFVRNDPRSKGIRPASVQFRLNPDGTLKSFAVVNAGDQAEEIAFIKSVVEKSIPFSPFPPDINKSARSLAMKICILPGSSGQGGFGFSRATGGRSC
jgi:hypothetical protein